MKPKVKYKVKPTDKQAKAMEILDNNRGMPVGKAMIEAGYSKASAKNPKNLTKARAIQSIAKDNGVTIEQYMMNIGQAMVAEKQNQFTGEINPDHAIRLSANKQAREFIDLEDDAKAINPELSKALKDSDIDEIELQRLVFKKT